VDVAEQRTDTLPEHQRGAFFEGNDAITALRVRGLDVEYPMLVGKTNFSLGSAPECDIAIDSSYLSALHCVLERRGGRVRVHDQDSRNGTFFAGRRETVFDIGPGDSFVTASTTLYALNEEMRLSRPVLAEIIGSSQSQTIDDALVAAVRGPHILILGEPGNDQDRLARAIHTASLRRRRPMITVRDVPRTSDQQAQLVDGAARGSIVLRFGDSEVAVDMAFIALVLKPESNVRVVACAPTIEAATRGLGLDLVSRAHQIHVAPLRERLGDLLPLLERWFIDRRTSFRVSQLSEENREALCTYRWPGNLEELRLAADRLVQLAAFDSVRQAAPALDIPRTTLQRWLDNLGLTFPLLSKQTEP
jgi:hypothetical protein